MKTLRIVLTCAAALVAAQAWAQDPPQPQPLASEQASPASQDMGGMTDAMSSAGRANQPLTRRDVYQDLVRSEQTGEQTRLWNGLYRGN